MTLRIPGTASLGSAAVAANPDDTGFDLVILAGQSNMHGADTGYAATTDPADGRVFQYASAGASINKVISATEPLQHWTVQGVGPGLPFARWYAGIVPTNRKVLLVPVAYNASGFAVSTQRWKTNTTPPENNLYTLMLAQVTAALAAAGSNARVTALLWCQGETDATDGAATAAYATNFDALIDGLRTSVGISDLPVVVGQTNYPANIVSLGAGATTVNAVHVETPSRKLRTAFVAGPGGSDAGDNLHFTAAQQRIIGKNMIAGYRRATLNVLGVAPIAPTGLAAVQASTTLNLSWTAPLGRATNYNVRYRVNGGAWTDLTRTTSVGTTATITGLTVGTSVDVQVRSVNEAGASDWSASTTVALV